MRLLKTTEHRPSSNLQMSAMVDVVFLLLVFFVMTFRITALEGGLLLKPQIEEGESTAPADELVPPIQVRLQADERGELARIQLNDRDLADVAELHEAIQELCRNTNSAAGDGLEVVLVCDAQLRYEHLVAGSDAVGGFRNAAGEITPLVRRVRFTAPATQARG